MPKEELLKKLKELDFSEKIIGAFAFVKRENFLPDQYLGYAYDDIAIPLEEGSSSISQPSTIALMLKLLDIQNDDSVLEIGSGSGYVLALLSALAPNGMIYGVEIKTEFAVASKKRLSNRKNVKIFSVDGSRGLPQNAPFDKIIVSAAAPDIGTIYLLLDQLKDEGIIVAPVKNSLIQIKKFGKNIERLEFPGFSFVPLVGD